MKYLSACSFCNPVAIHCFI